MSFKRDGDDGSQLNLLKKRRVAELLAVNIPEDEAMLMNNGRYACTVCRHRPVLDTVDMLAVHRAGNKHKYALERHFAEKRELARLVRKRQQESELKRAASQTSQEVAEVSPLLLRVEEAKRHTLLKEAPYNPCHSKKDNNAASRQKNRLFFHGLRTQQLKPSKPSPSQPAPNHTESSTASQRITKPVSSSSTHRQTPPQAASSIPLKPYVPKARRAGLSINKQPVVESRVQSATSHPGRDIVHATDSNGDGRSRVEFIHEFASSTTSSAVCGTEVHTAPTDVRPLTLHNEVLVKRSDSIVRKDHQKGNDERVNVRTADEQGGRIRNEGVEAGQSGLTERTIPLVLQTDTTSTGNTLQGEVDHHHGSSVKCSGGKMELFDGRVISSGKSKKMGARSHPKHGHGGKKSEQRQKELKRYLVLTSAGWVQDNLGQWVKGQDAEFDSDDDEPPPVS